MKIDKQCIQQVLGCLIKKPQYLSEIDKYNLSISDFPTRFERYIFTAIQGLYYDGARKISQIDIENYLSSDEVGKRTFAVQNGIEYLQDIEEFCNEDNFDYYYNKLKKLNLLRDLEKQGIDISDFYSEDLISPKAVEINTNFEKLTIQDILDKVKKKILKLESTYSKTEAVQVEKMSDDIDNFVAELNETYDIGLPIQGKIYNQVIGGAKKGTLTIRSGSSGVGKAIPTKTLLPTPEGFRTAANIKTGDYLIDAQGKPTEVIGIYPQGKKMVYKITFEDGRESYCCKEHLWSFVEHKNKQDILNRKFSTKSLSELLLLPLKEKNEYNLLIPIQKEIEYKKNFHKISPFVYGQKVGNGEIKTIATEYIFDSINNRYEFLYGLIKKSGKIELKKGTVFIDTKNFYLTKSIIIILNSLGFKVIEYSLCNDYYIIFCGKAEKIAKLFKHMTSKWYIFKQFIKEREDYYYNAIVSIKKMDYEEDMVCFYVDNKEHLFLTENFIVTHNTRQSIGDAVFLSYPLRYNSYEKKWAQAGNCEKVLFILTEQSLKEAKKMVLAYLTDINESRFKTGNFNDSEKKIISQAIQVIKKYEKNLIFIKIPDPNIELIKAVIRENCLMYNIDHVFYDYIFISPGLLNEFKGFNLRNDK